MYNKTLTILCLFSIALLPSISIAGNSTYGSGPYGNGTYGSSQGPIITLSIENSSISYSSTSSITCNATDSNGINHLIMKVNGRKEAELTNSVFTTISYSILFSPKDTGLLEVTCEATNLLNETESSSGTINVYSIESKSDNREKYTYESISLNPDVVYRLTVVDPEVGFSEIDIRVLKYINDVDFIAKPASMPNDKGPSGKVYKFIQINSSALDDSSLESATIRFSVPSIWLEKNNITSSDIVLQRYHNGEWQTLDTKLLGNSSLAAEFESETPGFSIFAISTVNPPENYPSFTGEQIPSGNAEVFNKNDTNSVPQNSFENNLNKIPESFPSSEDMPPAMPSTVRNTQESSNDYTELFVVIVVVIILGYLHYHRYPVARSQKDKVQTKRKKR